MYVLSRSILLLNVALLFICVVGSSWIWQYGLDGGSLLPDAAPNRPFWIGALVLALFGAAISLSILHGAQGEKLKWYRIIFLAPYLNLLWMGGWLIFYAG